MATQPVYNHDDGIGFDMRNAQLYQDSDDEEEEEHINRHQKPRPHNNQTSNNTCGYILLIIIIIVAGAIFGYSLGATLNTPPKQFNPETEPPNTQTSPQHLINHLPNTPSPTPKRDPFHNHNKKRSNIIDIFQSDNTPKPTPQIDNNGADKPAFEPSAMEETKAFEPSAMDDAGTPSGETISIDDVSPGFDIDSIKKILNDVDKYDLDFNDIALKLDDEYDLGDSAILSKIVLDEYEIPYVFEHAHKFNIKYPNSNNKYGNNLYKQWCFHFYLFDYSSAQIDISFNEFDLERGFDRILIRHFNQSFTDPPVVYAGRGKLPNNENKLWLLPQTITYHLWMNEFKSICIEMETDDSVNMNGFDLNIEIKYDDCQWSKWTDCNIIDESKKHWDRGPFYDGTCGIGVKQRIRTVKEADKDAPPLNNFDAFVDCDNQDDTDVYGPQYCLKAPCETVDNFHNPNGIPANIRYGWANKTTFYNGVGTLDATYPDLIRIYTANPSTPKPFRHLSEAKQYLKTNKIYQSGYPIYSMNEKSNYKFDLDFILKELRNKKSEILSEHIDEKVLEMPVLNIKWIDKTMKWLGARLTHSLLIGRVFTMIFTGSSNTAGHDNQFASTYPIQLQSRLRQLWLKIGNDGAGMNIRNEAVGGAPKTETMAWHIHSRVSETVSYPFNDIQTNGFRRNEDIIFWESFMNDGGRPPGIATEQQLRLTALLNAIWGGMNSIESTPGDKCNVNNDLQFNKLHPPKHLTRDRLFDSFTDIYGEYMGLIEMDFGTFVGAVCSHSKYSILKINWHPNSYGHRCEADIYAYMLLSAAEKFIENNKNPLNTYIKDKNIKELNKFLIEASGNWNEAYISSIMKKDNKLFPRAKYCQIFCDDTIAPFSLKTSEPNDWDTGFRLNDYIIYNYEKMENKTTFGDDMISDVDKERIADRKSRFSTEKLLRFNGWTWYQSDRDPPHFPQDKTGKIGSMDRKPMATPHEMTWIERYTNFLSENNYNDDLEIFSKINERGKQNKELARKIFGKYVEDWSNYILKNNYDLKVAFMIPEIGNHSLLMFTDEGGQSLYDLENVNDKQIIGVNLETMDGTNKINSKYINNDKYSYDFNKRLTQQRVCYKYQRGCVFHNISPGKYIMRYYPMNMTETYIPGLVQIIAF